MPRHITRCQVCHSMVILAALSAVLLAIPTAATSSAMWKQLPRAEPMQPRNTPRLLPRRALSASLPNQPPAGSSTATQPPTTAAASNAVPHLEELPVQQVVLLGLSQETAAADPTSISGTKSSDTAAAAAEVAGQSSDNTTSGSSSSSSNATLAAPAPVPVPAPAGLTSELPALLPRQPTALPPETATVQTIEEQLQQNASYHQQQGLVHPAQAEGGSIQQQQQQQQQQHQQNADEGLQQGQSATNPAVAAADGWAASPYHDLIHPEEDAARLIVILKVRLWLYSTVHVPNVVTHPSHYAKWSIPCGALAE